MIEWIKKLIADADSVPDDGRLAAMLVVLVFCILALHASWSDHPWSAQDYGTGAGLLFAGVGAFFGMRGKN